MYSDYFQLISALIGAVAVLALAYYLTRLYAKKMGGGIGSGRHMKVIDRVQVGRNSYVVAVDVAGKQYIFGVTENNVNMLSVLDEPLQMNAKQDLPARSFLDTFKSAMGRTKDEQGIDREKKE